jgi:ADP-ribose pyrophosphatase YjhB (NUDIX family)
MQFCPHCSTPLEIKLIEQRELWACPKCEWIYWNSPVPAAGCLIEQGGNLLLVRRKSPPHVGEWSLPVGFLQFGETAEQAAAREVEEETGLRVEAAALLGTYSDVINAQRSHLVLIFRGRIIGGALKAGDDAEAADWFSENALPRIAFASAQSAIATWRAQRQNSPTAYFFCPRCRSKLETRQILSRPQQVCATCDWIYWVNPIPIAETIVTNNEGHVLLIKRKLPPRIGDWALPGGFLDWGENAETAAIREVREETGLDVRLVRLLCTLGLPSLLNPEQCLVKSIFIGEIAGGTLQAGDDALDAKFFAWENLPENLATESTHEALRRWRAQRNIL